MNTLEELVPPPGPGLNTEIAKAPGAPNKLTGMVAISCVELVKLVGRTASLANTFDCETNPLPVTVIASSGELAVVVAGDIAFS